MNKAQFLKHSLIYWIGRMASRSVSFLLLPIYTAFILPADWGILNILFVSADLLGIIVTLQLPSAMYRFWAEMGGEPERRRLAGLAFATPLVISTIVFLPAYIWADWCARALGIGDHGLFIRLMLLTQQLTLAVEVMQAEMRVRDQVGRYAVLEIVQNFLIAGCCFCGVALLRWNALGVLAGQLAACAALTLVMAPAFLKRVQWGWDAAIMRRILAFALPLIPSAVAMAAIHTIDRYFIQHLLGATEVGIYSIGHRFGTLISILFLSPFLLIWDPKSYELAKSSDAPRQFGRIATYVVAILLLLALGLIGAGGDLVRILTAPAYHAAAAIVPIIVLSYVVYSLDPLLRFGLLLRHRTRTILAIVTISCVVNIAGNLILLPLVGLVGAAYATLAAFIVLVGLDYVLALPYFRFELEWGKLAVIVAVFVVVTAAASLVHIERPWTALGVKCAVFLAYPGLLALSGIFRNEISASITGARTFLRRGDTGSPTKTKADL